MKVFVMRHGEAKAPTMQLGKVEPDASRELTERGHEEALVAAKWLAEQTPKIDLVIVSPYVRAQQTYAEVAKLVGAEVVEVSTDITPEGDPEMFASALMARLQIEPAETVLLVSHMPFVCYLTSYLDQRVQPPLFPTAGIAVIDVEPLAMEGILQGVRAPEQH
ncbi:phosphohistidine phosphatase SixA [Idiomarina sp. A28L]|uniref:phosphohistidine phosphatase SixA n=1 Tax=Idiomarina sp. A28L TaxID=1036674 RepID=UPI00021387CA|nr:phosphohistidine phosphatase SixA [Idiomarina sp. A28L]EGN76441.1 phosphohistidine phosphatase SixA [Idiomarina sp. A28L]